MHPTNIHAIFRPNQEGLKKVLGDLEAEVMEAVWAVGQPVLVKDIHPRLPVSRQISHSTVACTMAALAEKNLLAVVGKEGKAYVYRPVTSREDFLHRALGQVIDTIFKAFPDTAAALLDEHLDQRQDLQDLLRLRERVEALDAEDEP